MKAALFILYLVLVKSNSLFSHLLSIILLPGIVAGLIPYYLNFYFQEPNIYDDHIIMRIAAYIFLGFGAVIFLWTILLFASVGKGTLAPWNPPRRLVVRGPYRYVRNPMIIGVISILIGEAFYLNSMLILIWAVIFFAMNTVYFELIEERRLERKFGDSYVDYKESVSRWIPGLKPYSRKS